MSYNQFQEPINASGVSGTVDTFTIDIIKIIKSIDEPTEVFTLLILLIFLAWLAYLFFSRFKKVGGANGHVVSKGKLNQEIFIQTEKNASDIKEVREDIKSFMEISREEHRAVSDKIDRLNQNIFSLALNQHPHTTEPPEKPVRRVPVKRKK